jgi:hypothetical protein
VVSYAALVIHTAPRIVTEQPPVLGTDYNQCLTVAPEANLDGPPPSGQTPRCCCGLISESGIPVP